MKWGRKANSHLQAAWTEYQRKIKIAWANCEKAEEAAWADYKRKRDMALADCDRNRAAAWREWQETTI